MTEQLEDELRHLFAEDAERAPLPGTLADGVRRAVQRRRQVRLVWSTGLLAAAAIAAVVVGVVPGGQQDGDPWEARPAVNGKGALPGNASASCVEEYSPKAVTGRAFAFDGTVTDINPGRTDRDDSSLDLVGVTFTVNEWFEGGSGATVTVDMNPPDAGAEASSATPTVAYGVGTRLLVSGEPRWGGAPLADAIAWGCGFTRYHDKGTASRWRSAFS
jgi:hypothetical protein